MVHTLPTSHPKQNARTAILYMGLTVGVAAVLLGLLWGLPKFGTEAQVNPIRLYPSPWTLPLFALVSGFGLALPLGCLFANRHNLRAVLRPTWGRYVAALALTALFPVGSFGGLPVVLGTTLAINLFQLKHPGNVQQFFLSSSSPVLALLNGLMVLAMMVLFSSALTYGLRWFWRIPAFVVLWIGIMTLETICGLCFPFVL